MSKVVRAAGGLFAALALVFVAFGFTAGASAAPYTNGASLSVSSTDLHPGGKITVTGTGFKPGETVRVTTTCGVLGTAVADDIGSFTATFTIPAGCTGSFGITATGLTSGITASALIDEPVPGTPESTGGLSNTGVAVLSLGGLGVALLAAGGLFVLVGRRKAAAG